MNPAARALGVVALTGCSAVPTTGETCDWSQASPDVTIERQITHQPHGHILTNTQVWTPDSQWIVYDQRSDVAGSQFDSTVIERVHVHTGEVQTLYRAANGAHCGVVTCSPVANRIAFIHGPEHPTADWQYAAHHRRGVFVDIDQPMVARTIDARDLVPPFTPGALRGGTHVHVFSGDGQWISFTYEDHVLAAASDDGGAEPNQRNIGVSVPRGPVTVGCGHGRNHDGLYFTVLVTRTVANPRPGSDEISKAYEDAWVGVDGYVKPDGTRQRRALAFQGDVVTSTGTTIAEVFIVDIPEDVTVVGDAGPLEGTATTMPRPPRGTVQRRLTFTADRRHPGIQGPRHWLRSSPDGSAIAFLMKDEAGIVQLWTVSPHGGEPRQVTRNPWDVASAFTWSPCGRYIAHIMDRSVFVTEVATGRSIRVTRRTAPAISPRPEACVFSPDGRSIAYIRTVEEQNQVFVVEVGPRA